MMRTFRLILPIFLILVLVSPLATADESPKVPEASQLIDGIIERLGYRVTTQADMELVFRQGAMTERFSAEVWALPDGIWRLELTAPSLIEGTSAVVRKGLANVMTAPARADRTYNLDSIATLFTLADDLIGFELFDQPWWSEAAVSTGEYSGRTTYEIVAATPYGDTLGLIVDELTHLPLNVFSIVEDERIEHIVLTDWAADESGALTSLQLSLSSIGFTTTATLEPLNDFFVPIRVETRFDGLTIDVVVHSINEATLPEQLAVTPDMIPYEDERFMEAILLTAAQAYDEARILLETLTRENPYHIGGHVQLGFVYLQLGDWMGARSSFEQALLLEPGNLLAANNLAYVFIESEIDIERGVAIARDVVAHRPTHSAYLDTLGWGLYKAGEFEEALAVLEDAIAYAEDQLPAEIGAEVFYHYALALHAVGRTEEARAALEIALEADPEHEESVALQLELAL